MQIAHQQVFIFRQINAFVVVVPLILILVGKSHKYLKDIWRITTLVALQ